MRGVHGQSWKMWLDTSDLNCFLPILLSSPRHSLTKSVGTLGNVWRHFCFS